MAKKNFVEHDRLIVSKVQVASKNIMTWTEDRETHFRFGNDVPTYTNIHIDSTKWLSPTPMGMQEKTKKGSINDLRSSGKKVPTVSGKEINNQSNIQIRQLGNFQENPFQSLNRQAMEQANSFKAKTSPYAQKEIT